MLKREHEIQKLCDIGDVYDSSYINFDYQFTDGYAGYKIDWDHGATVWDFTGYTKMGIAFKGPLPAHMVTLSGYRLNGELLFGKKIQVLAETRYAIQPFIEENALPLSNQVHCVRIEGAGVDVMRKMCR